MENFLKIGIVSRPQGIRGELKIQPLTDDVTRFLNLKEVFIDQKKYRVTSSKLGGDCVFVSLFGVNDRNTAELFRGKFLLVERKDAVILKKDNYFVADIIGCRIVFEDGREFGVVTDVTNAKTDFFTVKCNCDRVARFPFLKDALVSVDIENKVITFKEQRLSEIVCYED